MVPSIRVTVVDETFALCATDLIDTQSLREFAMYWVSRTERC